jgi:peroxiredoxin
VKFLLIALALVVAAAPAAWASGDPVAALSLMSPKPVKPAQDFRVSGPDKRLYQQFKDKGLVVLAISEDADGAGAVAPFVKKHGLTFPIGLDPKMSVATSYGVWALPSTFIIDRQGNRAHFANGPRDWDGQAGRAFFESILKSARER